MFKIGRNTMLATLAVGVTFTALSLVQAPVQAASRSTAAYPAWTHGFKSWGRNNFDQLGYFTSANGNHLLPKNVSAAAHGPCSAANLNSIKQISAGSWTGMALLKDGVVCSWGFNDYGQLGHGNTTPPPSNTFVPGPVCAPYTPSCRRLLHATAISAGGDFAMAIVKGIYHPNPRIALRGALVTWGSGMLGELGQGRSFGDTDVPELVCGIVSPSADTGPACPKTDTSSSAFLTGVTQVSAGEYHAMALASGRVVDMGDNTYCELGVGDYCTYDQSGPGTGIKGPYTGPTCHDLYTESPTNCSPDPVLALLPSKNPIAGVKAISASNGLSMVLLKNGEVMTYGGNGADGLGDDRTGLASPDTCYNDNPGVRASAGCAWYAEFVGGNADKKSPCYSPRNLTGVLAISAGFPDSLALLRKGIVCSWGSNNLDGDLGDGSFTGDSDVPVAVLCAVAAQCHSSFLTGVTQISAGVAGNNLALLRGEVLAWGNNGYGELGQYNTANRDRAVPVCLTGPPNCPGGPHLTGITEISSGGHQELALP